MKINYLTYWNTAYIVPLFCLFYSASFWQQVAFCPPASTVCIAEMYRLDVFIHVRKPVFRSGALCQYSIHTVMACVSFLMLTHHHSIVPKGQEDAGNHLWPVLKKWQAEICLNWLGKYKNYVFPIYRWNVLLLWLHLRFIFCRLTFSFAKTTYLLLLILVPL